MPALRIRIRIPYSSGLEFMIEIHLVGHYGLIGGLGPPFSPIEIIVAGHELARIRRTKTNSGYIPMNFLDIVWHQPVPLCVGMVFHERLAIVSA